MAPLLKLRKRIGEMIGRLVQSGSGCRDLRQGLSPASLARGGWGRAVPTEWDLPGRERELTCGTGDLVWLLRI